MTDEKNTAQPTKQKKKKSKIVLPLILVVILLVAAVSIFNLIKGRPLYALPVAEKKPQAKEADYLLYGPEDYTVNLADSAQRRFLKVRIALAYTDKKLGKVLMQRQAEIRNLVISSLRQCTAQDLAGTEGLDKLRSTLIEELNTILIKDSIKDIFFTDFLVQ